MKRDNTVSVPKAKQRNSVHNGCAWCSPSNNGTDGICDNCMIEHFGIDPKVIHAEIARATTPQFPSAT